MIVDLVRKVIDKKGVILDIKDVYKLLSKKIINILELMHLFWLYKQQYIDYFIYKNRKLHKILEESIGCKFIQIAQPLEWKVHYGSYYFKAKLKKKKVFIKVTSMYTKDVYENEVVIDDYIKKNSAFLAERTPKILKNFVYEDFHIIIFERFEIKKEHGKEDLQKAVSEFLGEYTEKGIIHQDLKPSNLTIHNEKYCIIDYGFSICPDSNHIRITYANYIEHISDEAKNILACADFYYDDAIACGMTNIDRSLINFIVGSEDKYFIKLAGNIYEYRLERLEGRNICLLHKVDCKKV